ncbi:MAG: hypothetical protein GF418_05480 [Chitinivibrionales bacterium]|nr:hypothetical protein [Chitinivibrionales bacterium]MBD3395063.1 hypothetical protein [Chitinivibrionales bacterium]
MNEDLRERIHHFSDEFLVEQYTRNREEYTDEALAAMKEELAGRHLDPQGPGEPGQPEAPARRLSREDFVPFEHDFSHVDLLLAQTVLREHHIPFYVDIPMTSSVLPLETSMSEQYTIHVLKERLEDARQVLGEHFTHTESGYRRKDLGTKDQLRSFNFHEVVFTEKELEEPVDVSFSANEKRLILKYVDRLVAEADNVEQKRDSVLFYYDNLEEVRDALSGPESGNLIRSDLLAILEVLQVYCEDDDFPQELESVAEGILRFLSQM